MPGINLSVLDHGKGQGGGLMRARQQESWGGITQVSEQHLLPTMWM